jgi:hypothetical protein
VQGLERYAVISCHAERPLDDRVWAAFERMLAARPAGFVVTPFLRPPDPASGEDETVWLARARRAAELAPLGHHTHWGGPTQARPKGDADAAAIVRREAEWLRERGLDAKFFCGGGWYLDEPLAGTLSSLGYVDCTSTTFRQSYLPPGAPRLELAGPSRVLLAGGGTLLELPATHSLGSLARGIGRLRGLVHLHFHDWELIDRRRAAAIAALLRIVHLSRRPLPVDELARLAADAPEIRWDAATIAS